LDEILPMDEDFQVMILHPLRVQVGGNCLWWWCDVTVDCLRKCLLSNGNKSVVFKIYFLCYVE
jgi:hypothetical protein